MLTLAQTPPLADSLVDYVLPNLPAGHLGVLQAPQGTGKRIWAMSVACAVACPGVEIEGLNVGVTEHGPVHYFSLSDPLPDLIRRMYDIGQHIPAALRARIDDNLKLHRYFGKPFDIGEPSTLQQLKQTCGGARLIIIDSLALAHTADESDHSAMVALHSKIAQLAQVTGAAVLLLEHTAPWSDFPLMAQPFETSLPVALLRGNGVLLKLATNTESS